LATTKVDVNLIDATGITDDKYLKGDGTWETVDALPSQTSQSGKFLTTNGTTASWATAGGNNVPRFSVYVSVTWDLADNTWTLTPYDSADVNDDGASGTCFNLTASGTNPRGFTVPAGEAGKYFLSYTVNHYSTTADMELQYVSIYKGASGVTATEYIGNTYGFNVSSYKQNFSSSVIVDAAVGDHFHVYSKNQTGDATGRVEGGRTYSNFSGFKLL